MDPRFRLSDMTEILETLRDDIQSSVRVAIPVKVSEDSSDGHVVKLQPLIKAVQRSPDGKLSLVELPVLSDVPIHHQGGGGVTLTHPHKKDDEGIFLVSCRSIDAWHQQGNAQPQIDARMHSLSDGFYIPGVRSNPRKLKEVSTTSTQMRSDDGKHNFDLHPENGPSLMADEGKHTIAVHPKTGIGMKTAMALAIDATKGMSVKGATHFEDAVTSNKSFGAPLLNGQTGGGFMAGLGGGLVGFLLAMGLMTLLGAPQPADGLQRARYAILGGSR